MFENVLGGCQWGKNKKAGNFAIRNLPAHLPGFEFGSWLSPYKNTIMLSIICQYLVLEYYYEVEETRLELATCWVITNRSPN